MQVLGDQDDYSHINGFEYLRTNIERAISIEAREKIDSLIHEFSTLKDTEKLLFCLLLPTEHSPGVLGGAGCGLIDEDLNSSGFEVNNYGVGIFAGSGSTSSLHLSNQVEQSQAYTWIMSHLEEDPSTCLRKDEVYEDYRIYCDKHNLKTLNTADFGKVMKRAFPNVKPRRLGQRGQSRYCYGGMRKKREVQPPSLPDLTVELLDQRNGDVRGSYSSSLSSADSDQTGTGADRTPRRSSASATATDCEDELLLRSVLGVRGSVLGDVAHVLLDYAQQVFGTAFTSLFQLAQHLVGNRYVNSRSRHAFALIAHVASCPPSSNGVVGGTLVGDASLSPHSAMFFASSFSDALQKGLMTSNAKLTSERQRTNSRGKRPTPSPASSVTGVVAKKDDSRVKEEALTPDRDLSTTPITSVSGQLVAQQVQSSTPHQHHTFQQHRQHPLPQTPPRTISNHQAYRSPLFQSNYETTTNLQSPLSVVSTSASPSPAAYNMSPTVSQQSQFNQPQSVGQSSSFFVGSTTPRVPSAVTGSSTPFASPSAPSSCANLVSAVGAAVPSVSTSATISSASASPYQHAFQNFAQASGGGSSIRIPPIIPPAVAAAHLASLSPSLRAAAAAAAAVHKKQVFSNESYLSPVGTATYNGDNLRQAYHQFSSDSSSASSFTYIDPTTGQQHLSHQPPAPLPPTAETRSPYAPVGAGGAYKRIASQMPVDAPGAYEPVTRIHLGSASPVKRGRFHSMSGMPTSGCDGQHSGDFVNSSGTGSVYSASSAGAQVQQMPQHIMPPDYYPGRYGNLGMLSPAATPCPPPFEIECRSKLNTPPPANSIPTESSLNRTQQQQQQPSETSSEDAFSDFSPKPRQPAKASNAVGTSSSASFLHTGSKPYTYSTSFASTNPEDDPYDNMPRLGASPGPQIPPSSPSEFLSFYSETANKQKQRQAAAVAVVAAAVASASAGASPSASSSSSASSASFPATTKKIAMHEESDIGVNEEHDLDRTLTNLSPVDIGDGRGAQPATSLPSNDPGIHSYGSNSSIAPVSRLHVLIPPEPSDNTFSRCERLRNGLLTPSPPPNHSSKANSTPCRESTRFNSEVSVPVRCSRSSSSAPESSSSFVSKTPDTNTDLLSGTSPDIADHEKSESISSCVASDNNSIAAF